MKTMKRTVRKLSLTTHVTLSVGWLGAVLAYLALAVAGVASGDHQLVKAAYLSMELIGWYVIVSCSLGALLTGVVHSLATEWGLFRHHWVLAKFVLTIVSTLVLVKHMPFVSRMAEHAASTPALGADFDRLRVQLLVHAVGGVLILLAVVALSVFKPWGRTAYGRRKLLKS